ncbi:carboxypeptidase B1-like [Culicoides brevitarsis]|uniref:carboxypeptidase B1-like n=1 Tax=Culicoides brevitarsis TaxID=469753 RepID=UPI00307C8F35
MIDWIVNLQGKYPKNVYVYSAGRSYEGRDIPVVVLSNGDGNRNKNTIVVDAGVHAREWISHAEALFIISQLAENSTNHQDLLQTLNWIIIPIANPDGYVYTQTDDRLWRKNRRPSKNSSCIGTDLNRNFGYNWGELGASDHPCHLLYRGESAFSEKETKIIKKVLNIYRKRTKFYLSLHAYGNILLYPLNVGSSEKLEFLAKIGADAILKATRTKYRVGTPESVIGYAASGASIDYALGVLQIPFALGMELPGGGITGFDPPTSFIEPILRETWIGIRAMAKYVAEKYSEKK